ncbi:protein kinase [Polyangium aurulentum]|nr:protein kinase [Polyangium aurulentum]
MRTGDRIDGRFEILARAGEGGMGAVYRALDLKSGEVVALKLLRDPDLGEVYRFVHEARILAELRHPHVVRYVTSGFSEDNEPYLVMEWLEGECLDVRLLRKDLGVEACVELGRRVASALAAAHRLGIVHRDIKPANLLLVGGAIERVKVLDFGIARLEHRTTALTQSGTIVGTPGYMAPEQARGDREAVGPAADVFSLGCVLFECLAGRPAFQGTRLMALLAKVLIEEAPRVRDLRPEVPPALDALVARMLEKDPWARPPDGAALGAALDGLATATSNGSAAPRAGSTPGITGEEKRLVSIVAIVPPAYDSAPTDSLTTFRSPGIPPELVEAIRRMAEPLGARLEEIAGGTLLAVLTSTGSPTDLAALAARCAKKAHALAPEAQIVLLTGRAETGGKLPVGEVLERAAALVEDAARKSGAIRIDHVTRALLDVRFETAEEGGALVLRGERPIADLNRTLLGKPTPFVGRERELDNLLALVEESFEDRRACAVLVTAHAGIGKSRLRHELLERLAEERPETAIALGRGDSVRAGSAFGMLSSAFRSVLRIDATDPPEARRDKLGNLVRLYVPEGDRKRVSEFLGEMLGMPFPDDARPALRAARQNASIMADGMQAAYVDFLRGISSASPTLLVLEDLHWGDAPSVKVLDAALRELGERPFVVLAFARPEVHELFPRLWAERRAQEIRLSGLPRRAAERLVQSALGPDIAPAEVTAIVDRAGGNAFCLEEIVRAVSEGRGDALPETVLGMVEARLLSLDPAARRVLRAASVFGETFWKGGIVAVLGEEAPAPTLFDELFDRELVVRRTARRFPGEDELAFRHALIREASYAMLTERDRTLGHRLAAGWLERVGEPDPAVLAEHLERGGQGAEARALFLRAAEEALRGGDAPAAITRAERGIKCGAEGELLGALLAVQAEAYGLGGDSAQSGELGERALALTPPGSLSHGRALASAVVGALFSQQQASLGRLLPRLLAFEPQPGAAGRIVAALQGVVVALLVAGAREPAAAYLRRLEQVVASIEATDPHAAALAAIARGNFRCYAEADPWGALGHDRAAAARFEAAGDRHNGPIATAYTARDLMLLGAFDEAEEALGRALGAARRSAAGARGGGFAASLGGYLEALVRLARGLHDEAAASGRAVLEGAIARGDRVFEVRARLVVVESELGRGALDAAEREILALGDPAALATQNRAGLLSLLAELRLAQGRADEALGPSAEALALARSSGVYVTFRDEAVALARANALRAAGDVDAARRVLRDAEAHLLARADRIEDPAYRRTFLDAVPVRSRLRALVAEGH